MFDTAAGRPARTMLEHRIWQRRETMEDLPTTPSGLPENTGNPAPSAFATFNDS